MTAEKLADEIRREAKAGSVEHNALNSRPGANVCIWAQTGPPGMSVVRLLSGAKQTFEQAAVSFLDL
jgi:hypothetical protein